VFIPFLNFFLLLGTSSQTKEINHSLNFSKIYSLLDTGPEKSRKDQWSCGTTDQGLEKKRGRNDLGLFALFYPGDFPPTSWKPITVFQHPEFSEAGKPS
jgi:hypothetical protein